MQGKPITVHDTGIANAQQGVGSLAAHGIYVVFQRAQQRFHAPQVGQNAQAFRRHKAQGGIGVAQKRDEWLHAARVFLTRQGAGGVLAYVVARLCKSDNQFGNGLVTLDLAQCLRHRPPEIRAALPGRMEEWLHRARALRDNGVEGIGAQSWVQGCPESESCSAARHTLYRARRFRGKERWRGCFPAARRPLPVAPLHFGMLA